MKLTKILKLHEDKNSLIKALKNNDKEGAKKALTGMSGDDLGLTHKEFAKLTHEVDGDFMQAARSTLGIQGVNQQHTTQTHNPVTGQPWTSGPVKTTKKPAKQSQGAGSGKWFKLSNQEAKALDHLFNDSNRDCAQALDDAKNHGADDGVMEHIALSLYHGLDEDPNQEIEIEQEDDVLENLALAVECAVSAGVFDNNQHNSIDNIRRKLISKGVYRDLGLDVDPDMQP